MENRMWSFPVVLLFSAALLHHVEARPNRQGRTENVDSVIRTCGYDSCVKTDPNLINVHIVPHTHDDVGWLKTVDQYYYGSKNTIQKAGVQYILDSVVASLLDDPQKKFIYVESAFFFKWYQEQTAELQDKVKMLVAEGRLEFIGGAWSMNDEATTHYQSLIDQFAWGLKRLNDTFGECGRPKVGWQIDPFGHSREMASLFAQMSYDGLFFGRLHYQDKSNRLQSKEMEMIWKASANLGQAAEIFTGALYNTYSPPNGFCWDVLCSDEPFVDNKRSKDYNVDRLLDHFLLYIGYQRQYFRTNNIILTMGGDFTYQDANYYYKNLDKLIRYGNERKANGSQFNFFYSTPSCYLKSLKEADIAWPTKSDDFFPYASDPTAVWTGYFTSRPTVKRYERMGNHFLQICKQLTSLAFLKNFVKSIDPRGGRTLIDHLTYLREEMGVMQHHDAVTGTEKQHVANDYIQNMYMALEACNINAKLVLNELTQPTSDEFQTASGPTKEGDDANKAKEPKLQFEFDSCHFLNISQCYITDTNEKFMVTVYNPLAHSTFQPVRIPVQHPNFQVRDYRKVPVDIQIIPIPERTKEIPYRRSAALYEIVFLAQEIPPLGYKSYYVESVPAPSIAPPALELTNDPTVVLLQNDELKEVDRVAWRTAEDEDVIIGNRIVQAQFDAKSGLLTNVILDGEAHQVSQEFFYYNGAAGHNAHYDVRSSGAYIFRPNGTELHIPGPVEIKFVRGDVVDEVQQKFNEWITQVVRIYHDNSTAIEFEWTVGPIPINDWVGKEIISRFSSDIVSKGVFYTDSNGREMIKRVRDQKALFKEELVAINYYPLNTKINIEDDNARMAVLTDRAQGASSLLDGCIDVMVHRRLLADDAFGVGEALNEMQFGKGLIANGKLHLLYSPKKSQAPSAAATERFLQNRILIPNWLFFSRLTDSYEDWLSKYRNIGSHLTLALPQNVYLLTLEPWRQNSYLVRFEHLLEKEEDINYSKPVTFDLKDVFGTLFDIQSVVETNLAGNQFLSDVNRFKFTSIPTKEDFFNRTERDVDPKASVTVSDNPNHEDVLKDDDSDKFSVTLNPMQIRTYVIMVNEQV